MEQNESRPSFGSIFRFKRARTFARSLTLKGQKAWFLYTKSGALPDRIPANPSTVYRGSGWKSYGDWLGIGTIAARLRTYRDFEDARAFARALNLKSVSEWNVYRRTKVLPADVPATPERVYRNGGWQGYGDWLGTDAVAPRLRVFRSFEDARTFARGLGLSSGAEWRAFAKSGLRSPDVPANPAQVYSGEGWSGTGDWLGTGRTADRLRKYRDFPAARSFARSLGVRSNLAWREQAKKGRIPEDIPADPYQTYRDQGWQGWGDWLGSGSVGPGQRKYRPFGEARAFVQRLRLKSTSEWYPCSRKRQETVRYSTNPNVRYGGSGWKGMGDWLGTGAVAPASRTYWSFRRARAFVRRLGLKRTTDWRTHEDGWVASEYSDTSRSCLRKQGLGVYRGLARDR